MKLVRAVCPACGREMAVRPPARSDGSVDVFPRHSPPGHRGRCDQSRSEVRRQDYVPVDR